MTSFTPLDCSSNTQNIMLGFFFFTQSCLQRITFQMIRCREDCKDHIFIQLRCSCVLQKYQASSCSYFPVWSTDTGQEHCDVYSLTMNFISEETQPQGDKNNSINGKGKDFKWYQIFCINKASCRQRRKFECKKMNMLALRVQFMNIPVKAPNCSHYDKTPEWYSRGTQLHGVQNKFTQGIFAEFGLLLFLLGIFLQGS